jgi:hypothetical protein
LTGIFSVAIDLSNTIYSTGTYYDVSGLFTPTSSNYRTVSTTINTVTVTPIAPSVTLNYTAAKLKAAGYTATQLNVAGYTALQLNVAGYTATQMLETAYNIGQLEGAGYTPAVLNAAGYVTPDMTVIATIGNASNFAYDFSISGNLMYVAVGVSVKVLNLTTNAESTIYTGSVPIFGLVVVGGFLYITTGLQNATGNYTVGKLNLKILPLVVSNH